MSDSWPRWTSALLSDSKLVQFLLYVPDILKLHGDSIHNDGPLLLVADSLTKGSSRPFHFTTAGIVFSWTGLCDASNKCHCMVLCGSGSLDRNSWQVAIYLWWRFAHWVVVSIFTDFSECVCQSSYFEVLHVHVAVKCNWGGICRRDALNWGIVQDGFRKQI